MPETPHASVYFRHFTWHTLPPEQGQAVIELVRSLGADPDYIDANFSISRFPGRPWRLHLSQWERAEGGGIVADMSGGGPRSHPLVFDNVALPDFLTTEEPS